MGEVVDDGHAVDFGPDFEAALDAAEGGEGFRNGGKRNALPEGERGGGRGVEGVVGSGHGEGKFGPGLALSLDFPLAVGSGLGEVVETPVGVGLEAIALDRTEGSADTFGYVGRGVISDDAAAARDKIHEALEGGLHRVEVAVNVGVVVFDMGKDEGGWEVVHELGTLVEEGRVVLIALKDERCGGAKLKAGSEVF